MSIGKSTVDERVVEMRIDNEKFEAGAKKTIGILESLDRSLKGLGQDNADGFDNIEKSLNKVTDRFSAMGIVGDQIMRNLTNKAMELVGQFKNMATMLTTQQIGAGWDKFASKTEAVQTIMASTNNLVGEGLKWANQEEQLEGVTEQLQRLTWFADETSYSFTDMVNNVGKFTAAGRELEESVTAMQGISTWAAISGGKPAEASRAMYNLSQALGLGAVTAIDWKSIELANMATYEFKQQAIDTAVELGKLKKVGEGVWETLGGNEVTVEKFRDTLTFGKGDSKEQWFDSDVLLSVLNRYGDFAQLVAAIQEDFGYDSATYVLSDLKEYEESLTKAGEAEKFLERRSKELGISLDELKGAMDEMLAPEYDLGRRAFQAAQEAKTFTEAIDATRDAVSTKWMDVFELLFGNYLEAKDLWTKLAETMWDIFARPVDHLIEIIEGAGGFLGEDGLFGGFTSGAKQAAGGTAVLEDRLSAVGKTMDDFEKSLSQIIGPTETVKLLNKYESIEDALLNGAISAETFKKALGALDDSYDTKKPVTLNRALNKAGKTMQEFEKALKDAMDPKDVVNALGSYESIEDAFRNGAISVEDFKEALASLGIDSENVTEEIDSNVQASIGSLEELRQFALEVLRGDHGNGDERLAWYESMGLDSELMQAMAGDLKNMGYYMSDEALMAAMESYYQYNNLSARLGYETFAEYLASITSATGEAVYDMNQMAEEADHIYASLFGEGVLDEYGDYISAGELFRKSLTNLMDALDNFGTAFDKAFMKVFGGSDDDQEQLANMSDGFFTLTAAFYSFSESVKRFSESEAFQNFATAMFSVLRMIRKAIGLVFKIAKTGLSIVMKLLSPVLNLLSGIFDIVTTGLDAMSRSFESSGIIDFIEVLSDVLLEKIAGPIEKINYVIDRLIEEFKAGFEDGGIAGGIRKVSEAIDILFQNHPVFLSVVHAFGKALIFLKDAIEGLAMVLGSVFGGAVVVLVAGFQKLGEWFGKLIEWAKSSEIMADVWNAITEAVEKFGRVIKRVFNYAKAGYEQDGIIGALTAVVDSFERGVTRLVPGGEKLVSIFNSIKSAVKDIFKKKTVDENGLVQTVDDTGNALLKLDERIEKAGNFYNVIRDGATGNEEQQASFRDSIKQFVANLWAGFLDGLRDIRISDVIDALRLGVIANALLKVGHGLNIFNGLADSIGDIPDRFTDMMEDLGQTFRSLSFDIKANAVLKFAVAAGMIAGAIFILSKIPEDKLEKASSVVVSILAVLSLLIAVLGKTAANILNSVQYLVAFGTSLIGLAAIISSIGLTALTLALVSRFVGVEHLKEAVNTILKIVGLTVGLVAGLIALVFVSGFNEWQIKALGSMMKSMGLGLMGLAAAVRMLMLPVLAFSLVLKFARGEAGIKKFKLAVLAVIGLVLAIGGFVAIIALAVHSMDDKSIRSAGNLLIKVSASMIGIAFAIQMLTVPIAALAALQKYIGEKETYNAVQAVGGLIGYISVLVGIFAWFLSKVGYSNMQEIGKTLLRTAASMVIVAVAIRMLVKPITEIAELSQQIEDVFILRSIFYLLGAISAIGLVLVALNRLGNFRSGDALIHIAGAIALLSFSTLLLTPAIILITAAIAGLAYALGTIKSETWDTFEEGLTRLKKFAKPLMLFGAALLIVGLAATLTGTGLITLALGVLVLVGAVALIMVALPSLVDSITKLRELDWNDIYPQLKKIASILGVLSLLILATAVALRPLFRLLTGSGFSTLFRGVTTGVQNGLTNGLKAIVRFLKNEDNKKVILQLLESLILVGAAYVAGILPTVAHVIVGGLVGLINAVAAEVSAQAPGIVDAFNNLVHAAVRVIAGLLDSVIGKEFFSKLTETEEGVKKVTAVIEGLGAVGGIATLVVKFHKLKNKLTGAGGVVEAVTKVSTVSSQVDEAMIALSGSAEGYFSVIASSLFTVFAVVGLTALAVGSLAVAVHDLAQQAKEDSDAMNEELYGDKDASIEKRADALEEITDKYDEVIAKEEELKGKLREAEKSGIAGEYEAAVDEYLEGAEDRIRYINDVEASYEQLSYDMANVLLPDAGMFKRSELARDILFKIKDADGDLSKVAEYQQYLELTAQSETDLAAATSDTTEITKQLTDAESLRQEQLERRKIQTQEATTAVQEETTALQEEASAAETAISSIDQLKSKVAEYGFSLDSSLGDIGMDKFQEILNASGIDIDLSAFNITGTEELGTMLETAGLKDIGPWLTNGIGGGMLDSGALGELFNSEASLKNLSVNKFLELFGIASPSTVMADEVGRWIPAGIGMGINQNYYQAVNPLYTLMDEMTLAFTNVRERFVGAGTQIVAGLIDGINQNMQYAYDAGQNLATSVENGFTESLKIESPSKVFMNLAKYIPMGISEGVARGQDGAIDSIVVLGDALVNAIMQSMAMVSTIADDDFELTPRITPVVDMTNVTAAANSMNSAFGNGYSMSAQMTNAISKRMADVDRIAADVGSNQTVNNGDNITFNIYGAEGQDPNEIADAVMLRMQNRAVRRGAAFG